MELLATVRATVEGYVQTKPGLDKSMGNMRHDIEKSHENMEKMRSDMTTHQVWEFLLWEFLSGGPNIN